MLEMSERESSNVRHTKPRAELRRRSLEAESRYTASSSGTLTGGPTVSSNSGTLTGGLTAFSRRPVLAEFRCVRGDARVACESVATQWSWRSYREQHHAVTEYTERKTDPMFSLRVD